MWIKSYPIAHDQIKNTKHHEEVLFLVDYLNQPKPFILIMYVKLIYFQDSKCRFNVCSSLWSKFFELSNRSYQAAFSNCKLCFNKFD